MKRTPKQQAELAILKRDTKVVKMAMTRLEHPLKLAKAAAEKAAQQREAQAEKLAGYASPEEAQEAFGFGNITEAEFRRICDLFEGIVYEAEISDEEAAYNILRDFYDDLAREVRNYEGEIAAIEKEVRA